VNSFVMEGQKLITMVQSAKVVEVLDKFGRNHMKPEYVADYSTMMHGVDAEQYMALYPLIRKVTCGQRTRVHVCYSSYCLIPLCCL
jgi:hypothetical protein